MLSMRVYKTVYHTQTCIPEILPTWVIPYANNNSTYLTNSVWTSVLYHTCILYHTRMVHNMAYTICVCHNFVYHTHMAIYYMLIVSQSEIASCSSIDHACSNAWLPTANS